MRRMLDGVAMPVPHRWHPAHWLISTQGLAEAARRAGHERGPAFDVLRRVEGRRVAGHGCAVSLCFTASAE